jgi:hypothetical protein
VPSCRKESGKQPVVDYFTALGGLMAFWQIDYTAMGRQVIAWGNESYTVEHCGLEGGCEFALVFDLSEGAISRLLVIEDLPSFMRGSGSLVEGSGGGAGVAGGGRRLRRRAQPVGAEPWSATAGGRTVLGPAANDQGISSSAGAAGGHRGPRRA